MLFKRSDVAKYFAMAHKEWHVPFYGFFNTRTGGMY
jgi:hypothetical protein